VFDDGIPITRRRALSLLAAAIFGVALRSAAARADDDGGSDDGDSDNSGSGSGGGGGNSGSGGSGGSGGGGGSGGDDNDDNDDDSDDDNDDSDRSGSSRSSDNDDDDDDRIRAAVRGGEAAPLRDILAVVRESYRGKIVNIRLTGSGSRLAYRIRLLDNANRLIELRVNAKTRKITSVRKL
jgi:uncharacterized membrane protein YkoI